MSALIGFPNPVNEKAARVVAGGVLTLSLVILLLGAVVGEKWLWLVAPVALGFYARVLTGPRLSVLGQLAMKVIAPRLGDPVLVAGPPKRFAQAIGATVTTAAVVFLAIGLPAVTYGLLVLMVAAAGLESIFAYCIGCKLFQGLMNLGLVPESTCEACANIAVRAS